MTIAGQVQSAPPENLRRHDKYDRLVATAQTVPKLKVAVVHPCDPASLSAVFEASGIGLIEPILVPIWVYLAWGDKPAIWTLVGGGFILAGLAIRYLEPLRQRTPAKPE